MLNLSGDRPQVHAGRGATPLLKRPEIHHPCQFQAPPAHRFPGAFFKSRQSSRNFNEVEDRGILVLVDKIVRLVHAKDADNRAIRIPDRGIPGEIRSPR